VAEAMPGPVLDVTDLTVEVRGRRRVPIVDNVSLTLGRGERLGIVGESGSGKSISMRALVRLIPSPPLHIAGGRALFRGRDLLRLSPAELAQVRGGGIAMIFQDPLAALNPLQTVAAQVAEAIRTHQSLSRAAVAERVIDLLTSVGLPDPERRSGQHPHEFSGGMRQRVMIAIALANDPAILIADEPTTALDVTIQAQVIALVLISHDIGLVAENVDRVMVMYAGRIVETGRIGDVLNEPRHPYTRALLETMPSLAAKRRELRAIPGRPALPNDRPPGCAFHPRCAVSRGRARCATETPTLRPAADVPGRLSACHFLEELSGAPAMSAEATRT
jgi:oligopeptide/dipeptide ABC transporter ATP-binding protein